MSERGEVQKRVGEQDGGRSGVMGVGTQMTRMDRMGGRSTDCAGVCCLRRVVQRKRPRAITA